VRAKEKQNGMSEKQKRKEKALTEFNDNFDVHYERRRKELHDVLMKKIQ